MKKKIGLYGGTFSPPHAGHVNAARNFVESVGLDKLYVMPANIPPHKVVSNPIPTEMRLEMCRYAFGAVPNVVVSDYECTKAGVSYTVETLRHLSEESAELYMLCGDDMFLTLDTWRLSEEIFSLATIVCMRRYDGDGDALFKKKTEYEEKYGARVIFIDAEALPVSSTEIREMIKNGCEDAEKYLDGDVISYINENGLYGVPKKENMNEKRITEEDILALREKIRPYLKEKRYLHTLAVEKEAEYLGRLYLPEKVMNLRAAALLHDITKKCDFEKQLQYCDEFGIIIGDYDMLSPKTFHSKTAAALIMRDFPEFNVEDIVSGVRWHTTGHDNMTVFEAIIYLADYIEETRTFQDCVILRKYFRDMIDSGEDKDLALCRTMVKSFDMTIANLISEGAPVDTDTVSARNYYLRLTLNEEKGRNMYEG